MDGRTHGQTNGRTGRWTHSRTEKNLVIILNKTSIDLNYYGCGLAKLRSYLPLYCTLKIDGRLT